MVTKPLNEILRPSSLNDVFGQEHLIGNGKIIRRAIETGKIPSMIFYGPPGVGKTTVARIIAKNAKTDIHMFNATYTKTDEIKKVISSYVNDIRGVRPIIYIDEIQNFNKRQQQILLDYLENGSIILIGSTTENPYMYVYKAIISRVTVLEFYEVGYDEIKKNIVRCVDKLQENYPKISITQGAIDKIASFANGDVRSSVNIIELLVNLYMIDDELRIDEEILADLNLSKTLNYDIKSDSYYDLLSAFHKSVRGSDENAALHYLAKAIKAGDIKPLCRRLLCIASEDIGLAYPNAAAIVKACVDSALFLGLPEAKLPLAQATILLATAPKSNSVVMAIDSALSDIETKDFGEVPVHLKDAHYSGAKKLGRGIEYKYPHNYENNYVKQQYLPDELIDSIYYKEGKNKFEQSIKIYWKNIKGD